MPQIKKNEINSQGEERKKIKIAKKTVENSSPKKKAAPAKEKKVKTSVKSKLASLKKPKKEERIEEPVFDSGLKRKKDGNSAKKDKLILNSPKKEENIADISLQKKEEPAIESSLNFFKSNSKNEAKNLVISSIKEEDEDDEEESGGKKENIDNNYIKNDMENIPANTGRSVKLYRKIAVSFIFLTIILIAVIFYFSFVKVTIVLEPKQERATSNLIFDVNDEDKAPVENSDMVKGMVETMVIEDEAVYGATGEEIIGEEVSGKVKIINNYEKNQPLVATTRLLTPDNKLYRIKDTVNVPAGGSIEVEIYADKPSQEMAIGPSKFTIPGLWAGLQDKIYAESSEDFIYGQKVKKYIIQSDIDNAVFDLKKKLVEKAKAEVAEKFNNYDQVLFEIEDNSIESDADGEAKNEKDEFSVSIRASVLVAAFNEEKVANLAEQKLISSLAVNSEIINFDKESIVYTLNNYDKESGKASISATFEGNVGVKEGAQLIEIDKILGLNEKQLEVYLSSLPEVSSFEVRFFPSFIKKVPKLVDRISVEIKK